MRYVHENVHKHKAAAVGLADPATCTCEYGVVTASAERSFACPETDHPWLTVPAPPSVRAPPPFCPVDTEKDSGGSSKLHAAFCEMLRAPDVLAGLEIEPEAASDDLATLETLRRHLEEVRHDRMLLREVEVLLAVAMVRARVCR
jgi:hypothetical protein